MKGKNILTGAFIVTALLALPPGDGIAETTKGSVQTPARRPMQTDERLQERARMRDTEVSESEPEQVYGWQLMTDEERSQYRAKMRMLQSVEERNTYRAEHHREMQARAEERGVTIPDMPRSGGQRLGGFGGGRGGGRGPRS